YDTIETSERVLLIYILKNYLYLLINYYKLKFKIVYFGKTITTIILLTILQQVHVVGPYRGDIEFDVDVLSWYVSGGIQNVSKELNFILFEGATCVSVTLPIVIIYSVALIYFQLILELG
ncbi:hypothetical protein ACJX0J_010887, partial [Zea mays]